MGICHKITGFKLVFVLFFLFVFSAFFIVAPVLAQSDSPEDYTAPVDQAAPVGLQKAFDASPGSPLEATAVQGVGFNTSATFRDIIAKVITMVLELLGVVFLILAIYGGYTWMMAGGNEEQVQKATKTLTNAALGLIIVLAAYALSRFIVTTLGPLIFKQ